MQNVALNIIGIPIAVIRWSLDPLISTVLSPIAEQMTLRIQWNLFMNMALENK